MCKETKYLLIFCIINYEECKLKVAQITAYIL
jgi:hypothetical protein